MMMLFKIFYREMPVKEYQTRYAFTEFHLKFSIFNPASLSTNVIANVPYI